MGPISFSAGDISATLTLDRTPFQQGLDAAKAEADAFQGNRYAIKLDADGDPFRTAIDEARAKAEEFAGLRASVTLDADTARFDEAMRSSRALAEDVGRARPAVTVTANTAQATAGMSEALAQAKRLEAEKALIKVGLDKILLENDILELRARVVEMDRLAFTIQAKADVIQAAAELAGLEAQAAALDRKEIQLRVKAEGLEEVKAATAQAAGEMSQLTKYAGLAAGALPLVGAAVVALPGLLAAAVVPAAAVALGLDGIKAAAQSLQTPFIQLKGAVSDTFEAGLEPAIRNVAGLLPTLQTGLTGAATSLSGLATNVTAVVTSSTGLQSIFAGVNNLITGLSPGISGLTSNLIGLAQQGIAGLQPLGAVFTQLSAQWQAVIDTLQRTGQGQAAVDALVQVLGGVLQLLPPLVQVGAALMAAIGPPLAAALQATADVLTPIANLFSALPGPVQTAAAGVIAFRVAMSLLGSSGGEAAAATRAVGTAAEQAGRSIATGAESTNRFTSAARSVGGALSEMGAAYASVALKAEQSTGGLREFGSIAGGVAKAGVTGLKTAAGGLLTVLGGPWGLAIGAATVGLGLLGDHMAANAQKAQELAQDSQSYANALSATGGVITSVIEKQVAQRASQEGLFDSAQKLGVSAQDVTSAITGQGNAAQDLTARLQGIIKANTTIGGYNPYTGGKVADSMNATGQAAQDLLDKLNGQIGAFKSGQAAADALGSAMGAAAAHFGEESAAADAANRTTALFAQAMQTVGDNANSASDKVKAFASAFQSASDAPLTFLDAQNKANQAIDKFSAALEKVPPAVVSVTGSIDTTTEAGQKLATSLSTSAKAYEDLYGATLQNAQAQGVAMPQAIAQAAAASSGYRERLIEQATAHGLTRAAAEAMANQYLAIPKDVITQIQQPGMVEAVANAIGLKGHVDAIPGGKSIIVDAPQTPAVIAQLEALGLKVTTLPGGKVAISAEDGATPVLGALTGRIAAIPPVNIPINATTAQAQAALDQLMGAVNAASGTVNINGNNVPAGTALQQIIDAINRGEGTVTVNGQTVPAAQALGQIIAAINAGKGTVTVNGQTVPAAQALSDIIGVVNRSNGTIKVNANTSSIPGQVNSAIAGLPPYTIRVNAVVSSHIGGAAGGIFQAMRDGGMLGFAAGGSAIPNLTPMSSGMATVVPPNTWRVIGDRLTGDEAFIPINSSDRSQAILAQTAAEMGWSLAPKVTSAGLSGVASTLSPASARRGTGVRGTDGAASGDIVAAIRELRADVQALQKAKGDVTINAPTYNPSAEPSSESQARALRTGAALVSLLPR